mmetsp:Transcript_18717/g.32554  ORF Transcript_18717/g.32554 Transcript_18717/m.32554 type:complete len:100 (+) Transcript_18717:538-837(+)
MHVQYLPLWALSLFSVCFQCCFLNFAWVCSAGHFVEVVDGMNIASTNHPALFPVPHKLPCMYGLLEWSCLAVCGGMVSGCAPLFQLWFKLWGSAGHSAE